MIAVNEFWVGALERGVKTTEEGGVLEEWRNVGQFSAVLVRISDCLGALQMKILSQCCEPAKWVYRWCILGSQKGDSDKTMPAGRPSMLTFLKNFIKQTPLYGPLYAIRAWYRNHKDLSRWAGQGKPIPPPHVVKEMTLKDYAERFNLEVLIESGTAWGDMVYAMKTHFRAIYSIELSQELSSQSTRRFCHQKHIHILQGDSSIVLGSLLPSISQSTLVWLDAHHVPGKEGTARGDVDTPIMGELDQIFRHPEINFVILIDDARCFDGANGYPTIEGLRSHVHARRPEWVFEVDADIVRIHAQGAEKAGL